MNIKLRNSLQEKNPYSNHLYMNDKYESFSSFFHKKVIYNSFIHKINEYHIKIYIYYLDLESLFFFKDAGLLYICADTVYNFL